MSLSIQVKFGISDESLFFLSESYGDERSIAPEIETLHGPPVAANHRLQHRAPASGAVHVAEPQDAALDIAKLLSTNSG